MIESINKTVVEALEKVTGRQMVKQNTKGKIPQYPFLTFTVTSAMIPSGGTYADYGATYSKAAKQIWSITAQSDTDAEAMALAIMASDYLEQQGALYLGDYDIVVQSVGTIGNRDTLLNCGYEYRYGFDVTFTTENIIQKSAMELAETIDTAEVSAE